MTTTLLKTRPMPVSLIKPFSARLLVLEHRFAGFEPMRWTLYGDTLPARAGESASFSKIRPLDKWSSLDEMQYVHLPNLGYSDYSGATYDVSNVRKLLEDYPDTFVETFGDLGTVQLYLPADSVLSEALFNTLIGLAVDYPCYDESDVSEYESELADEAWDAYLSYEVTHQLQVATNGAEWLDEITDEHLREVFYQLNSDMPEPYHADGSNSVHFPMVDDVVELMTRYLPIERWLLGYAWFGTDEDKDAVVRCIMHQDGWKHVDARTEQLLAQASGEEIDAAADAYGMALSALYECHEGPHLETCPERSDS